MKAGSNKNADASADLNGPPGVKPGLKKLFTARATVGVEKKGIFPPKTFQLNILPVGVIVEDATPAGRPPVQAGELPQGIAVVAVAFVNVFAVVLALNPKSPVPENAEAKGAKF